MKYLISLVLCFCIIPAHSTNYSCDILKNGQKIITLPGSLPNNNRIAETANNADAFLDPNTVLAYTLCQQAGFKLIDTQITVPGLRSSSNVTKIQQTLDPACSLKCTPMGP